MNNPIKEIILNISFDKKIEVGKLKNFCELQEIKSRFPVSKFGYDAKINLGDEPSSEFNHTGYILESGSNKKDLLNIKLSNLSYHIINRYDSFQIILENLDLYWQLFQKTFGEVDIRNISVRYINLIEVETGKKLDDYLCLILKTPFDNTQRELFNFSIFPIENDKKITCNIIVANNNEKNVILDLSLQKIIPNRVVKNISDIFYDLRSIKNSIFQKLITDFTKQKFNML